MDLAMSREKRPVGHVLDAMQLEKKERQEREDRLRAAAEASGEDDPFAQPPVDPVSTSERGPGPARGPGGGAPMLSTRGGLGADSRGGLGATLGNPLLSRWLHWPHLALWE